MKYVTLHSPLSSHAVAYLCWIFFRFRLESILILSIQYASVELRDEIKRDKMNEKK